MIGCADSLALFLRGEDWPREREMYNGCKGYCVTVMKDGWDKSGAVLGPPFKSFAFQHKSADILNGLKVCAFTGLLMLTRGMH